MPLSYWYFLGVLLLGQADVPSNDPPSEETKVPEEAPAEPQVMASFANRILVIVGTPNDDVIEVNLDRIELVVGDQRFPVAEVNEIVIAGEEGDDRLDVTNDWTRKVTLYGGGGDDILVGSGGNDHLYGGWGSDQLDGRGGDDILFGGTGRDQLTGGPGNNQLEQEHPNVTREVENQQVEHEVLRLMNEQRLSEELSELTFQPQLNQAALWHAENMRMRSNKDGYELGHAHVLDGVTMPTMSSRLDAAGYPYRSVRENVAFGYPTPAAVLEGWMDSPGHRANILASDVEEVGIAIVNDAQGTPFYCVVFAAPLTQPGPKAGFKPISTTP